VVKAPIVPYCYFIDARRDATVMIPQALFSRASAPCCNKSLKIEHVQVHSNHPQMFPLTLYMD
jgi:hypothetical protein